jgi:hypothetical protein
MQLLQIPGECQARAAKKENVRRRWRRRSRGVPQTSSLTNAREMVFRGNVEIYNFLQPICTLEQNRFPE